MFYRVRFDGFVGGILKRCGYDTSASLNFWPVGATPEWVKDGKNKGWKPIEAAAYGVSRTALERAKAGQISSAEARFVASMANQVARECGAREKVLHHLALMTWEAIPDAAKER